MHKEPKPKKPEKFVEKCPAWPGLPGKAQSKQRSGGVRKLPVYPKSEGL